MEMRRGRDLFRNVDRQMVDAVKTWRQEESKSLLPVCPEPLIVGPRRGGRQNQVDIGLAEALGCQLVFGGPQQVLEPDRILPGIRTYLGRHEDGDGRRNFDRSQSSQIVACQHGSSLARCFAAVPTQRARESFRWRIVEESLRYSVKT
jgi:hypothetical protein